MLRILHDTKYDFIKYWKTAVITTAAFIVLGMALMFYHKGRTGHYLNYSVEFTGGAVVQLQFAKAPGADAVRAAVNETGFVGAEVTSFGDVNNYMIRVPPKTGEASAIDAVTVGAQIAAVLHQRLPADSARVVQAQAVGARVGNELQTKAITAILISFVVTLIYLAFRFEWRFGLAAVIATATNVIMPGLRYFSSLVKPTRKGQPP